MLWFIQSVSTYSLELLIFPIGDSMASPREMHKSNSNFHSSHWMGNLNEGIRTFSLFCSGNGYTNQHTCIYWLLFWSISIIAAERCYTLSPKFDSVGNNISVWLPLIYTYIVECKIWEQHWWFQDCLNQKVHLHLVRVGITECHI